MNNDCLNRPVQYIKSVGPRRAASLRNLGINTILDLLYHFPRRYEDRTAVKPAAAVAGGEVATLKGIVLSAQDLKPKRGLTVTKLALHDGANIFYAVWFNQPFVKNLLSPGTRALLTGKVEKGYGVVQVMVEEYEVDDGGECLSAGRVVPVYPLTGQITQRLMRQV
ncbi:MAG: OB-fold nucleic acid binding domain-containing protein, partial [Eubacteriales bacterium]